MLRFHKIFLQINSSYKTKWYKDQKSKKLALNSWLQTYQILTNDDQMSISYLSYFSITVFISGTAEDSLVTTCLNFGSFFRFRGIKEKGQKQTGFVYVTKNMPEHFNPWDGFWEPKNDTTSLVWWKKSGDWHEKATKDEMLLSHPEENLDQLKGKQYPKVFNKIF